MRPNPSDTTINPFNTVFTKGLLLKLAATANNKTTKKLINIRGLH